MSLNVDDIFRQLVQQKASDLVFVPGAPPTAWIAGRMTAMDMPKLGGEDVKALLEPLLNEEQKKLLSTVSDLDFSVGRPGMGRLRVNAHLQRGSWSAAVRFVPDVVPAFESLHMPARVLELADLPHGLVLVTGGAGTGKSTTLAAMIHYMNHTHRYHVITLEDPVEFMHHHGTCLVEQREIGSDCPSFSLALRNVVRQRPDVILVGEMRDLETISAALTAAEMGHLVMASLHTNNAVQTIDRIIDIFPAQQQTQVRVQLSGTLQGVVCQTLFHNERDGGVVPAAEIMISTPGIRRAIRDGETHLLQGMIEMGRAAGMQTMDESIAGLTAAGLISVRAARAKAHNLEKLTKLLAV